MAAKVKNETLKNQVVIYQARSGAIEFREDLRAETIWATQSQIADLFEVNVRTTNEHLKNIYKSGELNESSTIRKFRMVQKEGNRNVRREVFLYNLDSIISVGYRVNSQKATQFRIWATKVLRAHIVSGYTINRSRIAKNYNEFLGAVEQIKKFLPTNKTIGAQSVLELIKLFAHTWVSLDAYDKAALPKNGATKKQISVTTDDLTQALGELKRELANKKEASGLFGLEREKEGIVGIIGNIFQSFGGKDLYPSIEEKAGHLLYFVVKNHPFTDGNKRIGAFTFVWFLKKAKILDSTRLTPEALTALTLLVAESNPKDKDRIIGLILLLLG